MAQEKRVRIDESWGDTFELDAARTGPIVFHFRPTKYMVVSAEKRKDWEEIFRKYVGLIPDRQLIPELQRRETGASPNATYPRSGDPKETISGSYRDYPWSGDPKETISGSFDNWDDCDYW